MSACSEFTDCGLSHVAKLRRLRQLDVSHCAKLTDAGFAKLGPGVLRGLEVLNVSGLGKMSDITLYHVVGSQKLQVLDVSGCVGVTYDGLRLLAGLEHVRLLSVGHLQVVGGKLGGIVPGNNNRSIQLQS